MDIKTLAKHRFSCRQYRADLPSRELIQEVMEVVRTAPSAANYQPWRFVVIDETGLLEEIKSCYARSWINSAPMVIAACGNHETSWKRDDGKDHCDIDLSIAIDHLTLAATDRGLGTCWICKFDSQKAAALLDLPKNWEVIALLPIGFPDTEPDVDRHLTMRKPMDEILTFNKFA